MARMRLLDLARPFSFVLPEVELPYRKVDITERLFFTGVAAFLYLLLAEVGLASAPGAADSADPVGWLRSPLAMSHGTLAELGVMPIILSGMLFQVMAGVRRISVSLDARSERALFQSLQKLFALALSAVFAVLLAFSPGTFGAAHFVATKKAQVSIAVQIFGGSAALVYLDELLTKGYGFVPGVTLFSLLATSQKFVWYALSLRSVPVETPNGAALGTATLGVFPSLFFNITSRSIGYSLVNVAFRGNGLPNLFDIGFGLVVFLITCYLSMFRFNLQIRSTKMRAQSSSFPVRLLYTGVQPAILVLSLLAVILLTSYALNNLLGVDSLVCKILGIWQSRTAQPISGLAALLVPSLTSGGLIYTTLRAVVYPSLFIVIGAWVGHVWCQSSGFAPQNVAKEFKENSIVLVGKRDISVVKELRRIIPLAATLGGGVLGLLVSSADLIGPSGWGSAMSVAALNLLAVFEMLTQEGIIGGPGLPQMM